MVGVGGGKWHGDAPQYGAWRPRYPASSPRPQKKPPAFAYDPAGPEDTMVWQGPVACPGDGRLAQCILSSTCATLRIHIINITIILDQPSSDSTLNKSGSGS
jgi:hypothetical protein